MYDKDSFPAQHFNGVILIECKKHHEERIRKITEIQDDAYCKKVTFFKYR